MNKILIVCLSILCIITSCNESKKDASSSQLLAMVMVDGKYGYINPEEVFIIKPQYQLARTFSNGLACVNEGGHRDNGMVQGVLGGKYYFIDIHNKKQFDNLSSTSPMTFYNNVAVIENDDQTKSLLNREGKLVAQNFNTLGDCKDDLIPAVKDKKLGFINAEGSWKIELPYKYFIAPFCDELSVFTDTDTKLVGYFNKKGEIAIPAKFKVASDFFEGLARIKQNNLYSFIKKDGTPAFEASFEMASKFSEGYCSIQKSGAWGFINKTGKLVIDYKPLLGVRDFTEGLAAFKQRNGKVGFMDTKGETVIKAEYDNALPFKNGYAIIELNGKMGFINPQGELVIEPKYTRVGNFVNPNDSNPIIKIN